MTTIFRPLDQGDDDDRSWEGIHHREISAEQWTRYEEWMAEILGAMGMDLGTPGTERTPQRFLRALFDATAGYEGDPKLVTAFPTECRGGADCELSQIVEGPIVFYSLCEHHALPFFLCRTSPSWPRRSRWRRR